MAKAKTPLAGIDWNALSFEISELFESGPVAEEELFAGRSTEVRRMLEAILDRSKQIILYGERGVGKTSTANIFWKRYNTKLQTVIACRIQAHPGDDYSSLWRRALEEFLATSHAIGKQDLAPISADHEVMTPDIVRREFQKCRANSIPIIIIDEYDQLRDEDARILTANTIKSFYDYSVNATIILVGVAEDIQDLINDHKSLRRAISQIKLDRMTHAELHETINKRTARLPAKIDRDTQWTIVLLSKGFPYYVHMLSKFTLQAAVEDRRLLTSIDDIWKAMDRLIEEEEESFQDDYRTAVSSPQSDNRFREVLLACALADSDDAGWFTPTAVLPKLAKICGKARTYAHFQRHLNEFILNERGNVLLRKGSERRYSYRFLDPMMQPYVVIRGVRDRLIPRNMKAILTFPEQPDLFPNAF